MVRLTALLLLLILGIIFVGVIALGNTVPTNDGFDLDSLNDIVVDLPPLSLAACAVIAVVLVRLKTHVSLIAKIILDFFFYSWHNSLYRRNKQSRTSVFEPEADRCLRLFCCPYPDSRTEVV